MGFQKFLHPLICTLISTIPLELIFQNHPGYTYGLEEGFIVSALCVPRRIKVADQCGKLIFLPCIVVVIKGLHKGLVELFRQFLTKNFLSKSLPEKSKCRIRHSVFPDAAVLLVMVILPPPNVKNNAIEVFRNLISSGNVDFRIQVQQQCG